MQAPTTHLLYQPPTSSYEISSTRIRPSQHIHCQHTIQPHDPIAYAVRNCGAARKHASQYVTLATYASKKKGPYPALAQVSLGSGQVVEAERALHVCV